MIENSQEAITQLYNDNQAKFLFAKKLAKHLSTLTGNIRIRAELETNLYSSPFKVRYSFLYNEYTKFNKWLITMCKEHPVGGKTTGRINDRHFTYTGTFEDTDVCIDVFGVFQSDEPVRI